MDTPSCLSSIGTWGRGHGGHQGLPSSGMSLEQGSDRACRVAVSAPAVVTCGLPRSQAAAVGPVLRLGHRAELLEQLPRVHGGAHDQELAQIVQRAGGGDATTPALAPPQRAEEPVEAESVGQQRGEIRAVEQLRSPGAPQPPPRALGRPLERVGSGRGQAMRPAAPPSPPAPEPTVVAMRRSQLWAVATSSAAERQLCTVCVTRVARWRRAAVCAPVARWRRTSSSATRCLSPARPPHCSGVRVLRCSASRTAARMCPSNSWRCASGSVGKKGGTALWLGHGRSQGAPQHRAHLPP